MRQQVPTHSNAGSRPVPYPKALCARTKACNSSPLYGLLHNFWIPGGGVQLENLTTLLRKGSTEGMVPVASLRSL
jgi:hypothetical protein